MIFFRAISGVKYSVSFCNVSQTKNRIYKRIFMPMVCSRNQENNDGRHNFPTLVDIYSNNKRSLS